MKLRCLACVSAVLVAAGFFSSGPLSVSPLRAQVHDVPSFQTPYGETGYGLHLIFQTRSDIGALFTWRRAGTDLNLGFRGGLLERGGEVGLLVGVELSNALVRADEEFPLDVAWVSGVGLGTVPALDFTILRIPFGVSLGRRVILDDGGTELVPYIHPRLGLDLLSRDRPDRSGTDARLSVDVDLGMDVQLTERAFLRFAVTLGRNDAVGVGLGF